MYNEDCIYFEKDKVMKGTIRICTCGCSARHDYMKFTKLTDDFFPDCTNCKYYISLDKVKKRFEEVIR